MAFASLANVLLFYICCILDSLYFVMGNSIFSVLHFILSAHDLKVLEDILCSAAYLHVAGWLPGQSTERSAHAQSPAFYKNKIK